MRPSTDEIAVILGGGPRQTSVREVWTLSERHLAEGDAWFLADLGVALHDRYGAEAPWSPERQWCRAVVKHLVGLLCLAPGGDHAAQAVRLLATLSSAADARRGAAMLAQAQAPAGLEVVFNAPAASVELRACLNQELVLRGVSTDELPALGRWTATSAWRHHPLAWLPPRLTPVEEGLDPPYYNVDGMAKSSSLGPLDPPAVPPDLHVAIPGATEIDPPPAESATGLFAGWGCTPESRAFRLSRAPGAHAVPALLASLNLDCLRGLDPQTRFSVASCRAAEAWELLFDAACVDGAYGSEGRHGAYSRLAAWRCLGAVCGAGPAASAQDVLDAALSCEWYRFDAATDWFDQVAWDVGLAVLGPDRRRLGVLAATDTD